MTRPIDLDKISIASPCSASWDQMQGDAQKRFCGDCQLHVFDLSAMTREQATDLLRGAQGRVCTRFYRRQDGTVLTADCPVGLRAAIRRRARRAWARVAACAGALWVASLGSCWGHRGAANGDGSGLPGDAQGPSVPGPQDGSGSVEVLQGEIEMPPSEVRPVEMGIVAPTMGRVLTPTDPASRGGP